MENFYYSAMYDILQEPRDFSDKTAALRHLRAKIIRLYGTYYHSMMVDNSDYDRFKDEEPSLHHLLKERKRQHQRTIHTIYDTNGSLLKSSRDILRAFTEELKQKYDTLSIQTEL
jgi:hypothetical protein